MPICPECKQSVEEGAWFCPTDRAPLAFGEDRRLVPTRVLGKGGFGSVYECVRADMPTLKPVAVKILHRALGERAELRFVSEIRAMEDLKHDHIVAFRDAGRHPVLWFSMERVEGTPLERRIANGALSVERAVRIGQQAAFALDHAHQKGRIHRDIKPANVMVGEDDRVTLLDFGIVKLLEEEGITAEGSAGPGTPGYQAPETRVGGEVTDKADVFSLGVTLIEAVTGVGPGDSQKRAVAMARLPHGLRNLLDQMVGIAPSGRPTARQVESRLKDPDLLRRSAATVDPEPEPEPEPDGRRWRAWVMGSVLALALAGAGFALRPATHVLGEVLKPRMATKEDLAVRGIGFRGEAGTWLKPPVLAGRRLSRCFDLYLSAAFGLHECRAFICGLRGSVTVDAGVVLEGEAGRLPMVVECKEPP